MEAAAADRGAEKPRRFYFGDIFRDGRYQPLHRELFEPVTSERWSAWLAPDFPALRAAAVAASDPAASAAELRAAPAITEEAPGVYSFDLFTPAFCDLLLAEVEHAQATARSALDRPNGMNRYGIVLNQLGLEPLITALQQEQLLPLQRALFPEDGVAADDHHCFIVRYRAGEDVGLDMHEDDSDVTLNVCLGKEFEAATLSFCGLSADIDHRKLKHTYAHRKGRAVVHLGRHRHGADDIKSGERVNFILWSTSKQYRDSEAYHRNRMRSVHAASPDRICLSYTHDRDYLKFLERPSHEQALRRGVMLENVARREAKYAQPVHDLAKPLEDINELPCVCLLLEGLPVGLQQAIFKEFAFLAKQYREAAGAGAAAEVVAALFPSTPAPATLPQLLFFAAVAPEGAVPEVRQMLGLRGSPALAVLDIDKELCYIAAGAGSSLSAEFMRGFVEAYARGSLPGRPLCAGDASDGPAAETEEADLPAASAVDGRGRSSADGAPDAG
eukprot:TRINITY_DN30439_c0_g1_i1.p1 TRINITY_DN30439_c0_g1~~TRINITY_DN30439_c0_g1_i1.p1  ORF type:complete len:539 (+),score=120.04 TRINITY_DN30439_c0_g1_i1:116-1618(+)